MTSSKDIKNDFGVYPHRDNLSPTRRVIEKMTVAAKRGVGFLYTATSANSIAITPLFKEHRKCPFHSNG